MIKLVKNMPAPVAAPTNGLTLIVLGRDAAGKPHAAAFNAADATLAAKAAELMSLRSLAIDSDALRALAADLPLGRVFASGRAFVPFVKGASYDQLLSAAGIEDIAPPVVTKPKAAKKEAKVRTFHMPRTWEEIAVGSLVLVGTVPGDGWFEGVVTEQRDGDLFVVRYRDWPDEALMVRQRGHLALLPKGGADL